MKILIQEKARKIFFALNFILMNISKSNHQNLKMIKNILMHKIKTNLIQKKVKMLI